LKEALEKALEAYRIASTPVTALEAGQLLVERGRLVEARDIVRSISAFAISPRESDKGREARQDAATLAATLDSRIPKIAIAGSPPGVEVTLDGKPLATNDPTAWLGVDPGPHALVARSGDRTCASMSLTLAEAEARTIDLHDSTSACRKELSLPVPTENPAPLASPPPTFAPIKPEATTPREAPPSTPERDTARSVWGWAGAGVAGAGVAAIGVGGGIALAAKGSYDSVASQCVPAGCTSPAYNVRESARSQADAATAVMIGGAIAAAGGVLLFALAPSAGQSDASRTVVGLGPGSVRIAVPF
jgi:hypothetical protein